MKVLIDSIICDTSAIHFDDTVLPLRQQNEWGKMCGKISESRKYVLHIDCLYVVCVLCVRLCVRLCVCVYRVCLN